jgi:prophage regulatory protein
VAPILLSREELRRKGVPYSTSQLYRKIKDGSFPAPVRLGENRVAWPENEIDDWINARIAAPRTKAA